MAESFWLTIFAPLTKISEKVLGVVDLIDVIVVVIVDAGVDAVVDDGRNTVPLSLTVLSSPTINNLYGNDLFDLKNGFASNSFGNDTLSESLLDAGAEYETATGATYAESLPLAGGK